MAQPARCAVSVLQAMVMQPWPQRANRLSKLCLWEMVWEEEMWLWHCPWSTSQRRGLLTKLRPTEPASDGHYCTAWHPLPILTQEAAEEAGLFPAGSEEHAQAVALRKAVVTCLCPLRSSVK